MARSSAIDGTLALITTFVVSAVLMLFQFLIPSSGAFGHLQEVDTTLPFAIRFALTSTMGTFAALIGVGLLSAALIVRWLKRPSLARGLLLMAPCAPLLTSIIGSYGLFLADRISAFPPDAGLHRCECPKESHPEPIECHCGGSGSLWAVFFHAQDVERSGIGDRLFFGSGTAMPQEMDRLIVRDTLRVDASGFGLGETLRVEGVKSDPVDCQYPGPCKEPRLGICGPCEVDGSLPTPTYRIRDDLRCVDQRSGNGAILDGAFLQLHRTIWLDPTGATEIPLYLDPTQAISTEKAEIIGTLRSLEGQTLKDLLLGAGRAPKMRSGGTRICRTTAGAAGPLAGSLDRELPDSSSIIVRIDVVEGN